MNEYLREIFEIITIFPPLQSTAYLIPSGSIFNAPHGPTYRYKGARCKVTKSNGETVDRHKGNNGRKDHKYTKEHTLKVQMKIGTWFTSSQCKKKKDKRNAEYFSSQCLAGSVQPAENFLLA